MFHRSAPNPLEGLGMHNDWHGELGKFIPVNQLTMNQNVFKAPLAVANAPKTMLQTTGNKLPPLHPSANRGQDETSFSGDGLFPALQSGIVPFTAKGMSDWWGARALGVGLTNGRFDLPAGHYRIQIDYEGILTGPADATFTLKDVTGSMPIAIHHTKFPVTSINPENGQKRTSGSFVATVSMLKPWTLALFVSLTPGGWPVLSPFIHYNIHRRSSTRFLG